MASNGKTTRAMRGLPCLWWLVPLFGVSVGLSYWIAMATVYR